MIEELAKCFDDHKLLFSDFFTKAFDAVPH